MSEFSKENFCRIVNHNIQINRTQYLNIVGEKMAPKAKLRDM